MQPFVLELLDQHWIDHKPGNTSDGCSHGRLQLTINSVQIVAGGDEEWTVSTSALQLLRSVFRDHAGERDGPLILHCGMLMMLSCPISVSWDVSHKEGLVEIKNVVKVPTVNQATAIRFPEADARLTLAEYGRPILQLADDVAQFFSASRPRRLVDDYERAGFESFIKEFDEQREKVRALLR